MHEDHLQEFNLIGITKAGLKYKKHIFLISIVGLVGGLVLAFVIKPKYEASTIFYPSANSSISKSILDNNNLEELMEFGSEDQTDQMLQILNSDQLKEQVISKFDLMNHYSIGKDAEYAMTKVKKQFAGNSDFRRTDYLAINITITDEDPEIAAQIANYVSFIIDSIKTNIQKARTQQAFEIIKTQYFDKKKEIDSLQEVMTKLRLKGIYDYESQSEVLSTAIVKAETQFQEEQARLKVYEQYKTRLPDTTIIRAKGRLEAARAAVSSLKPRIETFGKYSGDYLENEAMFEKQKESLALLQSKYENAFVDYHQTINQKFIIDKAQKPEMKAYPNRLLVVIVSVFSAFLIGLFMAIYNEIINPRLRAS
jgi:uncharacterized protein involved in exopolysaccharide biosynthesis